MNTEVMERPEVVETVAETKVGAKRGRKSINFSDKKVVAKFLRSFEADERSVSRYFLEKISESGYVERVQTEVEAGRRGRKPSHYVITGKGRSLLSLSKNWKMT
jgi:hypothetical protein